MRASLALLVLVPALTGCYHRDRHPKDTSTFAKRMECAKLGTSDKWDDVISPPYLDRTYYSPSLDTCVFVMKGTHRGEKDGDIHRDTLLIDALSQKQLWVNDPENGDTEDQLAAKVNQELQKLQINP